MPQDMPRHVAQTQVWAGGDEHIISRLDERQCAGGVFVAARMDVSGVGNSCFQGRMAVDGCVWVGHGG